MRKIEDSNLSVGKDAVFKTVATLYALIFQVEVVFIVPKIMWLSTSLHIYGGGKGIRTLITETSKLL